MTERVETAAVLGAGVMGMGIAAHLASAGIRVHLLDIVPKEGPRNAIAAGALQKALKAKPAVFLDARAAALVTPGNFDDDLGRLAECDLVVEAVVENLAIKKSLFAKVEKVIGGETILASNTSGLSIAGMFEDLSPGLRERCCVMHFFNPVRYMKLLEVVRGPDTSDATMKKVDAIGELLGKGLVFGKDTTNFVANRIGTYSMMHIIRAMKKHGLSIEQVDKIAGPATAKPKTGVFKLGDLVGLDTMGHVAQNCYDTLTDDPEREMFAVPEEMKALAAAGALGRKTGAGFYKKVGKEVLVFDFDKKDYRPQEKVRFDSLGAVRNIEDPGERLKALIGHEDAAAKLAWENLAATLVYSARLVPEIADDVVNVDRAMKWGFNWDLGPFEMWDAIGVRASVERMTKEGIEVPANVMAMLESGRESFYEGGTKAPTFFDLVKKKVSPVPVDPRHLTFAALKADPSKVVKKNLGASLVDIGDGVVALEVHTKMNTIDDDVIKMLHAAKEVAEKDFDALVIANDGGNFGAGANLMLIVMGASSGQWDMIEKAIGGLQQALQGLRYAKVPVVAAPYGLTLGGCAEIAMAADACQAYAETYMGLVEVGAGLIPAGGGCLRMVERWMGSTDGVDTSVLLPFAAAPSLNIAMAKVATGAPEAKTMRYLREDDGISMSRDLLLYQAKQRALGLAGAGYRPALPRTYRAAGLDAAASIKMSIWGMKEGHFASEHDALVAGKVAHTLCGGNVAQGTLITEQDILDLEREAFLSLCGEQKTQERIQALLTTGKPLRN